MPTPVNRRFFLGASAGALTAGTVLPALTAADTARRAQPAYGPPPGIAKLNANENPFGPSEGALAAMGEAARNGAYYVGNSVQILKEMIAERHGLTADHISLSAGSSGVLTYLGVAALRRGRILGPDLFWDTTALGAARQGGTLSRTAKTDDLAIDLEALEAGIADDVSLVHICNPNNPTGLLLDGETLRAFCRRAAKRTLVLVDEAYNELTDDPDANTVVPLVKEGLDVFVARTFSKIYGLAGMRIGYMISTPENAAMLQSYGLGDYAMNQAGVAAAVASYDDTRFLARSKAGIIEGREMILDAVKSAGLEALPSATNFVFVKLGGLDAEVFRQHMAGHNVLIRGIYRDYRDWSRVSVGLPPAVAQYVDALPRVLEAMNA